LEVRHEVVEGGRRRGREGWVKRRWPVEVINGAMLNYRMTYYVTPFDLILCIIMPNHF
jgi:hypothetical protein